MGGQLCRQQKNYSSNRCFTERQRERKFTENIHRGPIDSLRVKVTNHSVRNSSYKSGSINVSLNVLSESSSFLSS